MGTPDFAVVILPGGQRLRRGQATPSRTRPPAGDGGGGVPGEAGRSRTRSPWWQLSVDEQAAAIIAELKPDVAVAAAYGQILPRRSWTFPSPMLHAAAVPGRFPGAGGDPGR